MDHDFRIQFNKLKPKIHKQWLLIVVTFFGAIPYLMLVTQVFCEKTLVCF